jgi:hypothetical protein
MNAKYCECVNERKKKFKKSGIEVEPTTLCIPVHCSTHLHHHIRSNNFILKVNDAQFKHTTSKCGRQEGNL